LIEKSKFTKEEETKMIQINNTAKLGAAAKASTENTHYCRYCRKEFSKNDKGVETRATVFGESLYHRCKKVSFPNKFVALDSVRGKRLSQFFG